MELWYLYSKAIQGGGAAVLSSETDERFDDLPYQTGYNVQNIATNSAGDHYHNLNITDDGNHWHQVTGSDTSINGVHWHPRSTSDVDGEHIHWVDDHKHHQTLIPHFHEIEIPDHVHGIEYGVYEGPTATAVGIFVDGNLVPGSNASGTNIDLVDYLELDEEGKIKRGHWHTIEIVPNTLSRIVASVMVQFFVNSRGGGNH